MAITKKLIHFNQFSNFNTQKLSANRENTSYKVGVSGAVVSGEPYILYQSIVFIKDVLKIWTHGSLYDCGAVDLSAYLTADEIAEVYATIGSLSSKQDKITDLETIRSGASKGATAVQPSSLANVATSGSYNDLSNKPTIPSAVTESTVSGWGFTKNTGTYSKPSTGIPKTDLASAVQTSLGKADTALQSHQDISGKLDVTTAASTYLTKTDAASTYLGKTAKAASATTADSATKATQDASGNVITSTYATKTELANKQDKVLKFENVVASNWAADSTYSDFGYHCDMTCTGATDAMFAEVVFSQADAVSGDYAMVCETMTDVVRIYSKKNVSITVPTIIIHK